MSCTSTLATHFPPFLKSFFFCSQALPSSILLHSQSQRILSHLHISLLRLFLTSQTPHRAPVRLQKKMRTYHMHEHRNEWAKNSSSISCASAIWPPGFMIVEIFFFVLTKTFNDHTLFFGYLDSTLQYILSPGYQMLSFKTSMCSISSHNQRLFT